MKKLLLSVLAAWIGLAAYGADYYLIGGFNNWSLAQSNCKFTAGQNGEYTLDLNIPLTSAFKINDGTWSNDDCNYGSNGSGLVLGETYNLGTGGSSGDINFANSGLTLSNAHLVFNPTAKTLVVTGSEQTATTVYGIHGNIFGSSDWVTENMTESNGKFVLSNKNVTGGEFGIKAMNSLTGSQTSWISADGNAVVTVDATMACKVQGANFKIAAGTYTFTFDPAAMTLVVSGTQTGETPDPGTGGGDTSFDGWWVNVMGPFNEWADNGVQPVDGIGTLANQGIGTGGFKIKVWNGSNDIYYVADGEPIATDTWVQLKVDDSDAAPIQIQGATEGAVYTVKFNCSNNQVYVTPVGGGGNEGSVPEHVYLIGSIAGNPWNIATPVEMTSTGEGVYSIKGVELENGADGATMAYFALTTIQSSDWNVVNANRFGPAIADTEATVGDNRVDGRGDLSWSITAGTYNMTFNYNTMTLTISQGEGGGNDDPGKDDPVDPTPGELPAVLYLTGDINGIGWVANNGVAATGINGVYTWTDVTVDDSYNGNGYFSFATKLGAAPDDWDNGLNTGARYGATEKDAAITGGSTATIMLFAVGENADTYAWMAPAGKYKMEANLNTMTLTLTSLKTDGVSSIEAEGEAVYFDLQGRKIANPERGIYVTVVNGKAVKVVM